MRLINILVLSAALAVIAAPVFHSAATDTKCACAFAAADQAQEAKVEPAPAETPTADSSVVLYRVMGVVLIVWFGLAFFLFMLDRRVAALENEMRQRG
ncbi:MAG: CcmD family protein [Spirochaetes bacterium]|nr:CcmD family protein [Spirochaetota bacterium]